MRTLRRENRIISRILSAHGGAGCVHRLGWFQGSDLRGRFVRGCAWTLILGRRSPWFWKRRACRGIILRQAQLSFSRDACGLQLCNIERQAQCTKKLRIRAQCALRNLN